MYEESGTASQKLIDDLLQTIDSMQWSGYLDTSRDYFIAHPKDACPELPFKKVECPFFLKIKPGGKVHRHKDNKKDYVTYHIPIMSNTECWCFSTENNKTVTKHLKVGKMYIAERTLEHWSCNDGDTDRIHLLVPVYEN